MSYVSSLKNSFSLEEYRLILKAFKEEDYKFVSFSEFDPNKKWQVIVRHDIDFEPGLKFAYIENALGISASYHFLIVSHYNFLSERIRNIVRELKSLGHVIGYHHDESGKKFSGFDIALIFDDILDSYSLHRPMTYGKREPFPDLTDFVFSKEIRENSIYLADSNCTWKFGHPFNVIRKNRGMNVQLVTHPIWWTEFNNFTREIRANRDRYRALNIKRVAEDNAKLTEETILKQIRDGERLMDLIK